jgi:hypothetical protein
MFWASMTASKTLTVWQPAAHNRTGLQKKYSTSLTTSNARKPVQAALPAKPTGTVVTAIIPRMAAPLFPNVESDG